MEAKREIRRRGVPFILEAKKGSLAALPKALNKKRKPQKKSGSDKNDAL